MKFVCLQDEKAGHRRNVFEVIAECTRQENERVGRERKADEQHPFRFKKVLLEADRQFQEAVQDFISVHSPHYFVTVNFNFANDAVRQAKEKYSNQRPRRDWLKNLDAVLNDRIVKRRANRLPEHMKISLVSFDEYTTTENLHCHLLLWIPEQTRHSNCGLTKEQVDLKIQWIITGVLEHFFPRASVDVQAIYSKGAVTYATKCVNRSSEIDWSYWRKPLPKHDAVRLNNTTEFPADNEHDDTANLNSRLGNYLESGSNLPPANGVIASATEVGRREAGTADHSTSTGFAAQHTGKSNSAWRLNFRSYSYRTVIGKILATWRHWFTIRVADG